MTHQIYVRDPFGNLQDVISRWVRLEYARGESKTGYMYLDLDPNSIDTSFFKVDARIEPWRQVGSNPPYINGESIFFVRKFGFFVDTYGREVFRVTARDANYLVNGRNVDYAAGSAQASKTDQIDDMIKAIVRENMGTLATDTTRSLSPWLSVQVDLTAAPSTTKEFSHRQISDVLAELINESFEKGTYLAYDIIYTSPTTLEFRTYVGRRGVDHGKASSIPVVVSRKRRNLENAESYEDHTDEFTHITAGGQGVGATRVIMTATDTAAIGLSPFNRREKFIDARMSSTDAGVQAEADAELYLNRARKVLTGRIVDTDNCKFGVDYRFGDVVYAEYNNIGYDAHVNTMHVIEEGGRETIDCQIRGES
jgi:hypothetical protein